LPCGVVMDHISATPPTSLNKNEVYKKVDPIVFGLGRISFTGKNY